MSEKVLLTYRCAGCGSTFECDEPITDHPVHSPGCDGSCRGCPVQCGPVCLDEFEAANQIASLAARVAELEGILTAANGARDLLVGRITELEGEVAKLRECVNAADALSDHAWRLQKNERWSSDGSHRLIHSDGMLNLEGYDREYRAARAEVENG